MRRALCLGAAALLVGCATDEQKRVTEAYMAQLTRLGAFDSKIATEVVPSSRRRSASPAIR